MSIRRVVPDIKSERVEESREFYVGVLGFKVAMDMGWVVTFASPTNPTAQITVMRNDGSSRLVPQVTVEVADVDAVYACRFSPPFPPACSQGFPPGLGAPRRGERRY